MISNDDCRCKGTQCKKRDTCLRYTDRTPQYYWIADFSVTVNKPCEFYIKKGG